MNLNKLAANNIERFLKELGIDYEIYDKRITLPCPVHKGDNPEGCSIYYKSEFPYWKCFTHNCHSEGKGIVKLISGILNCSYGEAVRWIECRVGKAESINTEKFSFIYENKKDKKVENRKIMTREEFLKKTLRPAKYFLERGFKKDTLMKYDVGNWSVTGEIVIPVYDDKYANVIGYIERTKHKKCCLCDLYHDFSKLCPTTKEEKLLCRKWKNSYQFYSDQSFYNMWFAKESIIESHTVFLVEGQGDVWRMYESGINNCLGMYGVSLKPGQRKILDDLGVKNIILFLDPDEAGLEAAKEIERLYGRYYNFYRFESKYDPGDSSEEYIRNQFNLLKGDLCTL